MKSAMFCLAAIAAAAGLASAQNLLVNGDLESPADAPNETDITDGWTLVEPDTDSAGGAINSATFVGFANRTPGGDRGLWFRSFEGGLGGDAPFAVNATLFQDVAATAGQSYTFSAWFRFERFYTSDNTILAMQFLDAGDNVIDVAFADINTLNARDGEWREFSVSAIAAAGTVKIRAAVDFAGGRLATGNPQSAFVDDLRLVPAPSAAALLALGGLAVGRRRR